MVTLEDIRSAQKRIRGIAVRTPLVAWRESPPGEKLYIKPESLQPIGSFKLRGAYNKIASLPDEERKRGVITYSSGNHAQGVAYAARRLGTKATIVIPSNAPKGKLASTVALGAEIVTVGPASSERQAKAEELAAAHGYAIVPPYNDKTIIAGQGTIGMEILEDLADVDCVLVPVGGGGLISGVAASIKLQIPGVKVIGVEPELAADAQASLRQREIVTLPAEQTSRTLADGLRTQSIGPINFEHICRYVDDIVTVTEAEIFEAVGIMALKGRLIAEPSGAVTLAAYLHRTEKLPTATVTVAVLSGGNIEENVLRRALGH